ncbi:MAG: HD domain-containing protein [Deltaproteobacteria bacterium]|nr:HD domain-containing protein [Deltaproteobacteria bacterium]
MRCPGQDSRYWKHDAIFDAKCPDCGTEIEFFKDQTTAKCQGCGKQVINPKMDFGCASYCQYAEQCMGELPPELLAGRDDLLKDRVAIKMKMHFRKDFRNVGQATKVARFAGKLAPEEGANPAIVLCAAYLHNIGAKGDENPSPEKLEKEAVRLGREILESLKAKEELTEQVLAILDHLHHPGKDENLDFQCVHDALRIFELQTLNQENPLSQEQLEEHLQNDFMTESGRELARKSIIIKEGE